MNQFGSSINSTAYPQVLTALEDSIAYKESKYLDDQRGNQPIQIDPIIEDIQNRAKVDNVPLTTQKQDWQNELKLFGLDLSWYQLLLSQLNKYLAQYASEKGNLLQVNLLREEIEGTVFLLSLSTKGEVDLPKVFGEFKTNLNPKLKNLSFLTCINTLESTGCKIHPYKENGRIGFATKLYFSKKPQ